MIPEPPNEPIWPKIEAWYERYAFWIEGATTVAVVGALIWYAHTYL